ncbi:unnamed protein product [Alopecurus aequalis]
MTATVMVTSWYIWWSRRQIKNKEPVPTPERSVVNIKGIIANYSKLKDTGNMARKDGWKKPATGVLKLNVDASFLPDTGTGSIGSIIRDAGGNFVAACCDSNAHAIDVASMEALALLAGLKLVEQIGGQSVIVESDSMEVVQAILNPSEYRGTGAVIIDDCRQLIATLGKATIHHCPREANGAAHALARYGANQDSGVFWFVDPPDFLISILVDDRIIIQ